MTSRLSCPSSRSRTGHCSWWGVPSEVGCPETLPLCTWGGPQQAWPVVVWGGCCAVPRTPVFWPAGEQASSLSSSFPCGFPCHRVNHGWPFLCVAHTALCGFEMRRASKVFWRTSLHCGALSGLVCVCDSGSGGGRGVTLWNVISHSGSPAAFSPWMHSSRQLLISAPYTALRGRCHGGPWGCHREGKCRP